jgi:acetolactate synthase regulatory subunit
MTHLFQIRYRNTQGTLMRILMAASRRGLPMPYVQATPSEDAQEVRLLLDVTEKQSAQLYRDWHATVDVLEVSSMLALEEGWAAGIDAGAPIPPASTGVAGARTRSALA